MECPNCNHKIGTAKEDICVSGGSENPYWEYYCSKCKWGDED